MGVAALLPKIQKKYSFGRWRRDPWFLSDLVWNFLPFFWLGTILILKWQLCRCVYLVGDGRDKKNFFWGKAECVSHKKYTFTFVSKPRTKNIRRRTPPPQSRMIIFFLFPQILQLISQLSQREPVNPEFEFEEMFMHFYLGLLWELEERSEILFPFFLLYEIKLFLFSA